VPPNRSTRRLKIGCRKWMPERTTTEPGIEGMKGDSCEY
jgi:hypothetical protein